MQLFWSVHGLLTSDLDGLTNRNETKKIFIFKKKKVEPKNHTYLLLCYQHRQMVIQKIKLSQIPETKI